MMRLPTPRQRLTLSASESHITFQRHVPVELGISSSIHVVRAAAPRAVPASRISNDKFLAAVSGRKAGSRSLPADLTTREAEVICLIAKGLSNKEIGAKLFISAKTVEHHVGHIYDKIGPRTRPGAAMFAVEHGLCTKGEA